MAAAERWGNYLLEERIAAGGMAEVFRARRVGAADFSRLVCIKRLHSHLSADPEFVALFLDEARTGAKLRHRNIVAIEDLGEHEGRYFLAMEFVNGVDLARLEQRLRAEGLAFPVAAATFVAAELLAALHAAHEARDPDDGAPLALVHRDVAPHNVLVSFHGEVKLTDFGIARAARRTLQTQGDVVRGRFGYMPLEQSSGGALDSRADLFALGVVLFELLTGRRPFRGDDPEATFESIIAAQVRNDRPWLPSLRPDTPPALASLIEQLLSVDPRGRPASAAEALQQLAGVRELSTGASELAALLGQLFPAHASVAALPRVSAPSIPSATPRSAPPRSKPVLALVEEPEPSAPPPPPAPKGAPTTAQLAGLGLVAVLLGGGVSAWLRLRSAPPTITTVRSAEAPPVALPALPPTPAPPPAPLAAMPPSAQAAAPLPSPAPSPRERGGRTRPSSPAPPPSVVPLAVPPSPPPVVAALPPPAPVPEVSPPPPPPAPQGTLSVVNTSWGTVTIDNGSPRPGNWRGSLAAGRHRLRFAGGIDHSLDVEVEAGHLTIVTAEPPNNVRVRRE